MIACTATPADLRARLSALRGRIEAAGGDPEAVTVVGVTKGFDASAVAVARAAGLHDLGESYAQEMLTKVDGVDDVRWHWVGRLQRNKVRQVAPHVGLWHSVDRASLGAEIARRAPGAAVLAQVNTSGEDSKGGCAPAATAALVADLRAEGLDVRGLMTVAHPDDPTSGFRTLRTLADDLGLQERSMGMSDDLEAAIAEGATIIRVGTALFGRRAAPPASGSDPVARDG